MLSDGTFTGDGNWDLNFGTKELVLRSENGYEATTMDGGFDCIHDALPHTAVAVEGGQTAATRIEGLTVQRFFGEGGHIRCVGASPAIRGCRFRLNRVVQDPHGLNIVVQAGAPTVADCVFEANGCYHGGQEGIALYARNSWVHMERCAFFQMEVQLGALVNIDGGVIADCVFEQTSSGENHPDAMCVLVSDGEVSIQNCRFLNAFGSGVRVQEGEAQVLIGNCTFEDNVCDVGAAVFSGGASTTIRNTTFHHNYSGYGGGIVYFYGASNAATLDHCVFLDNTNGYPGHASAVSAYGTDLQVAHCTFVRNRNTSPIERGSTVTIWAGTQLLMDHTIIALGGQADLPDGAVHCEGNPGSVVVMCSNIFGNDGGDWTGCVAGMDGTNGNFSADPLFCDLAAGDLSLHGDSPCAPASTGECGLIGALGPWCGPLAVEPHSWGSIKALYR